MAEHIVQVTYPEELTLKAARLYWFKEIGTNGFIYLVLMIGLFIGWWALGLPQWWLGFVGGVIAIWAGFIIFSYFRILRFSLNRFRAMERKTATFTFSDDHIRVEADTGKAEFPWKTIDKIIEYPNVWLFSVVKSSFFTLPLDSVDDDVRAFIKERLNPSR